MAPITRTFIIKVIYLYSCVSALLSTFTNAPFTHVPLKVLPSAYVHCPSPTGLPFSNLPV